MLNSRLKHCLTSLAIAVSQEISNGHAPADDLAPSLVIEQFEVFVDGDALLVPVQIGGKEYPFLLDTGSAVSGYDTSLSHLLGNTAGTRSIRSPNGSKTVAVYDAPDTRLGTLKLQLDSPVICLDYQKIREVLGHEFYGVIGMDALHAHVIRLDSDHKKLMILRSPGKHAGESLSLTFSFNSPLVMLTLPTIGKQAFKIDTGDITRASGLIDTRTLGYLFDNRAATAAGASLFRDASQTKTSSQVLLEKMFLGDFKCRSIVLDESVERKCLSLRFLTRFNATFDFPRATVYLERSIYFDRPDRCDLSGLHFFRRDGQTIIEAVDPQSPAAVCDAKEGDIIVSVNGQEISEVRAFAIREVLGIPGTTARLKLKRGQRVSEVSMRLAK
jgi:hypothetical protein